jgi:hypothetical protein
MPVITGRLVASWFSFSPFREAGCNVDFSPATLPEPLCVVVGADVSGDWLGRLTTWYML